MNTQENSGVQSRGDEGAAEGAGLRLVDRLTRDVTRVYLLLALVMLLKVLLTRYLALGDAVLLRGIALESAFVLGLLGVVDLLFYRWRPVAYFTVDALLSVFLLAISMYAAYFERVLALDALTFVGQVGAVRASVLALLEPAYVLYFIDLPVLVLVYLRHGRGVDRSVGPPSRSVKATTAFSLAVALVITLVTAIPSTGADGFSIARVRGVFAYQTAAAITALRDSGGVVGGVIEVVTPEPDTDAATIGSSEVDLDDPVSVQQAIDTVMRPNLSSRRAGFAKGDYASSNVIIIQVESLQNFVLGTIVETTTITPNLNALAGVSWYFPNGFTQSGVGTTSDAEFATNTSLYPPADDAASVAYVDRKIPSLPRLLAGLGYDTFTMHANTVRYWNRQELYPAIGFARYYDRSFFATASAIGMGASDRAMFRMAWPEVEKAAQKGPFYSQIVTLSPHHPFVIPESLVGITLPSWLDGSVVGNYLEAMNYEDRQVGWFVKKLKTSGLWDKSIVIVYGDHGGLRVRDLADDANEGRFQLVLGHPYTLADRLNVPIIVHLPKQTSGILVGDTAGQIDILPTVADALGLDLSSTPHFGRDLFESSRPLLAGRASVPAGSFINNRVVGIARQDFADSYGVLLATWLETELLPEEERDRDDALKMSDLSHTYVRSLPKRDSRGTEDAIIPVGKR
jgi:lipoteichoic acid synthase